MNFTEWLDADRGRLTALAAHFNLTQSAVSQWRNNGVPPRRMCAVRDFTGGQVSLESMLAGQGAGQPTAHAVPTPETVKG